LWSQVEQTSDKPPIYYPGGKIRARKKIAAFIPEDVREIVSPFFGAGSVELWLAAHRGVKVYAGDSWKPIVEFWKEVFIDPERVASSAYEFYPMSKSRRRELQVKGFYSKKRYERAAQFFALSRSGYGSFIHGGLNAKRFTRASIQQLAEFKTNISISLADWACTMDKHLDKFAYLDPPYFHAGGRLYEMKVDHEELCDYLKHRKERWLLSYDNCEEIKTLYKGFKFDYPQWSYGISPRKKTLAPREILIRNYD